MKAPGACRQCRESKRKCTRPGPGEPCRSCQQRRLECGAVPRRPVDRPSLFPESASSEAQKSQVPETSNYRFLPDIPRDMTEELVEAYLDKVHDRPHSLFHPPTLRAQLRSGAVGGALLCAICAIGSKFSSDPDRRVWEARLITEAKRLLQADLENVCVENIQACILIATLSAGHCQTSSEALFIRMRRHLSLWVYIVIRSQANEVIGIATSMADIIHLDSSGMDGSITACETARRVWLSLYVADRWCFSGLGLPRRMDGLDACEVPMDETMFRSIAPDQKALGVAWKPGIWAHMVTLVRLFGPIQDLNRRVARGSADPSELDGTVEYLGKELNKWTERLPKDAQMTVQNLHRQQQNGLGGPFVALHLAFHHYSTLLYFRFLEDQQTSSSAPQEYVSRCKHHASSFSSLLHLSRQMKGCETSYPTVGHMTAVSSSVLVHTLLFGGLDELQQTRRELNANFEALVDLKQYWPATEYMVRQSARHIDAYLTFCQIKRLMTFQNICLSSTESHRLDGWMVRFLLEHSLPLEKRALPFAPPNAGVESNVSDKARDWSDSGRYTDFASFLNN